VDVAALPDVVCTYERFGNSVLREPFNDSHLAQPLLVVKRSVFELFEKEGVRGAEFIPVNLEG
jgi:hypothetical protein